MSGEVFRTRLPVVPARVGSLSWRECLYELQMAAKRFERSDLTVGEWFECVNALVFRCEDLCRRADVDGATPVQMELT